MVCTNLSRDHANLSRRFAAMVVYPARIVRLLSFVKIRHRAGPVFTTRAHTNRCSSNKTSESYAVADEYILMPDKRPIEAFPVIPSVVGPAPIGGWSRPRLEMTESPAHNHNARMTHWCNYKKL